MDSKEMGRKGGKTTKERYGKEHYSKIGKSHIEKYGPDYFKLIRQGKKIKPVT